MRHSKVTLASSLVLALGSASCLPTDTLPEPGKLNVAVVTDGADFETADGFDVHLERFLATLGDANLVGLDCVLYDDTFYARVVDLLASSPQTLATLYAVHRCDFIFDLRTPDADSPPSAGVSAAEMATLVGNASIWVRGSARQSDRQLSFDWRVNPMLRWTCGGDRVGETEPAFTFHGGEELGLDLAVHAEALFAGEANDGAPRFAPFAAADSDGDGALTEAELAQAPSGSSGAAGATLATDLEQALLAHLLTAQVTSGKTLPCQGQLGDIEREGPLDF